MIILTNDFNSTKMIQCNMYNSINYNNNNNIKMAFGEDTISNQHSPQEYYYQHQTKKLDPEQILDTFVSKGGNRYYKIRWKDSWEREDCLISCGNLIKEFWDHVSEEHTKQLLHKTCHHELGKTQKRLEKKNEFDEEKQTNDHLYRVDQILDDSKKITRNQSSSPSATAGRRKGRPKKLVNMPVTATNESLEELISKEEDDKDMTDNFGMKEHKSTSIQVNIQTSAKSLCTTSKEISAIEEYPVMIIRDQDHANNTGEERNPHQITRCCRRSPSGSVPHSHSYLYFTERSRLDRLRYGDDAPDINSSRKIVSSIDYRTSHQESCFSKVEENDVEPSKLSPVYLNGHQHTKSTDSAVPSAFGVIKSREYFSFGDKIPIVYDSRPLNGREGSRQMPSITKEPLFIKSDIQEKSRLSFSSDHDQQIEASRLLLKVKTEPLPKPQTKDYKFPYQAISSVGSSIIKHTKDHVKSKLTNITHKLVDGEQRPQCMECFQTFKKRAALERHMMIHRGIKPFQCHFCNQRFRQKHHLQGHIMLHTGERPHSCTLCNKRFRMRHHLLEHERISHKVFR